MGTSDLVEDFGHQLQLIGQPQISDELVYENQSLFINTQNRFDIQNVVLGSGDWTVEFWVKVTSFAAGGYAIPLMQLGTQNEGADGFGLSLFSNHSGIKQVYVRYAYSALVGADFPGEPNTAAHVAIVKKDGITRVVVDKQNWSTPLTLPADFSQPKLLRVGDQVGAWLQARDIYIDELRVHVGVALYEQN